MVVLAGMIGGYGGVGRYDTVSRCGGVGLYDGSLWWCGPV